MDFNSYQEKAKETIQKNASEDKLTSIVPFLGIIGEIGSLVTELKKKFRDGDAYIAFKNKLEEELGDVEDGGDEASRPSDHHRGRGRLCREEAAHQPRVLIREGRRGARRVPHSNDLRAPRGGAPVRIHA